MSRAERTTQAPSSKGVKPPKRTVSADGTMSKRQVLEALSGLLMGMFVSILAGTVVSTSMPLIISDLNGNQSAYTWVITSTLLATTVSTPLWGKFADLFNRKLLIQLALAVFVLGSALAGFSQNTETLIVFRVLQGLGAGGLAALSQIIMADIISPRDRGKYAGLFGAVMALGTVGGPLLGGVVTDAFGWRWNFFIALPVAIAAIIMLQLTLHLPKHPKRKVRIDYLGAVLITSGVSLLLIWVTMGGSQFEWASLASFIMIIGAALLLIAAVIVEFKTPEPIIPLTMFKNRTFTLAVVASISVGVSMFGTSVFLAQYMQLARGATPTQSGLLTIPMMAGLLISSTFFGTLISRRGKWKSIMVVGSVLIVAGSVLLGTLAYDTSLVLVGVYMAILGAGVGMVMQNLVLVVQNSIEVKNLGVATSAVTFFRSLGGTIGVTVLGSALGTFVAQQIKDGIPLLSPADQATAVKTLGSGAIPHVSQLPGAIRTLVESAYGSGVGTVFLYSVPLAIVTLIAVIFLPNAQLGNKNAVQLKNASRTKTGAFSIATGAVATGSVATGSVATGSVATGSVATGSVATGSVATGSVATGSAATMEREIENAEDTLIDVSTASVGLTPVGRTRESILIDDQDEDSPSPESKR